MSDQELTDTLEAVRLLAENAIARGLGRHPTEAETRSLRQSVDRMRELLAPRLVGVGTDPFPSRVH